MTVRLATHADRARVFEWRNHPDIRVTASDPAEIPWNTHERWFDAAVSDPDRRVLIAERQTTPIGVVRYDLDRTNARAEISIFLAPEVHGLGLGRPVLRGAGAWLASHEPAITRINAKVLGANERSRRLFESVGFRVGEVTLEHRRDTNGDLLHGAFPKEDLR